MHIRYSQFTKFRHLFEPRKPRNPLARVALGLLGLVILAVLIVGGLFIGAAMILGGVAWKLLAPRKSRVHASASNVVDAEYRVVRKAVLPHAR